MKYYHSTKDVIHMMRSSFVVTFVATFLSLTLISAGWAKPPPKEGPVKDRAVIKQNSGKVVYWVLPGPRPLSEEVFGTPENPKFTLKEKLAQVGPPSTPPKIVGPVKQLLKDLPFLVAAPMKMRETNEAGTKFTKLTAPTLFSDKAQPLPFEEGKNGWFKATYINRVDKDQKGPPGKTIDEAKMEAEFNDPQGNRYRVKLDHVVQPPFPGYKTQGGVIIDGVHHGTTGTGSPLMPKVYTRAAFWGVGNVWINGEKLDGFRVMHMMTTDIVRDKDYNLVLDEELPLKPEDRHIENQPHHTHLVVLPIKPPPPTFNRNVTEFELKNGKTQPFIHMMFEQDRVVEWDINR